MRSILKGQWLDSGKLERLQMRRLQEIIHHAYQKVPYYRNLFHQSHLKPGDIKTKKDLQKIPITSKTDLRLLPVSEITDSSSDLSRSRVSTTSGSTGIPFTIYKNYPTYITASCLDFRGLHFAGYRFTDRLVAIGPSYYPTNLFFQKIGIGRTVILSPFTEPAEIVRIINSCKPDVLHCYPSVFKSITAYIRDKDVAIHAPRVLISSAEYLDSQLSDEIMECFGSRPVQLYGSWEIGRIGNECINRDGIHLNTDLIIPEFIPVDTVNDEPVYRIILTSLYSLTMPFIRYDQGDLVQIMREPCSCGRVFPKVRIFASRACDVIRLPNGNMVSALYVTSRILPLPGIEQFKIIQESIDRLVVKIVERENYSEEITRKAFREIDSLLPGIRTDVEIVRHIEREPSGKFRQFQSHL
jgi:phenylacetate-CoA ligase